MIEEQSESERQEALGKFWGKIDSLRTAKKLSNSELAKALGLDLTKLSKMKHGKLSTNLDVILSIAWVLDVAPSELFEPIEFSSGQKNEVITQIVEMLNEFPESLLKEYLRTFDAISNAKVHFK